MSDSVRPRRGQPTRLPRPRDSPGKNTGVGCHFLLRCIKVKVKSLSRVRLFTTPWTVAHQAPPSMGFSRQEYWSGVPLPSPSERLVPSKGHVEGHPGHRGLSHKMRSLDSGNWKCPAPIYGHKLHHPLFSNPAQLFLPTCYMLRTQVGVDTGAQ